MADHAGDWVTLQQASEAVKVPATVIRDWYTRGAIESKATAGGPRLVRLMQVQEHATGFRRHQNSGLRDRTFTRRIEKSESIAATQNLARALLDLQAIARVRLEPSAPRKSG
jgi:hypothetical protein